MCPKYGTVAVNRLTIKTGNSDDDEGEDEKWSPNFRSH